MTTRYDAVISRKDKDGKSRYTKIGAAFPSKQGDGFNIVLDALPMPNAEGQAWISLFVPKPREDSEHHDQRPAAEKPRRDPISSGLDDGGDIPF
ncbi:MAG: hypothetical protein V4636_09090 [Pseudomonadota bacterium]